jgi:hypothetical protein
MGFAMAATTVRNASLFMHSLRPRSSTSSPSLLSPLGVVIPTLTGRGGCMDFFVVAVLRQPARNLGDLRIYSLRTWLTGQAMHSSTARLLRLTVTETVIKVAGLAFTAGCGFWASDCQRPESWNLGLIC